MALKIGEKAPDFTLKDQDGKNVTLSDVTRRGPVVLFFYPKDHTSGCTREVCSFRDNYDDFRELGAEVLGVSGDSADSHVSFREKHNLAFTLLSDEGGKTARAFGVKKLLGLLPGRETFLIDKDGVIRFVFSSALAFHEHVTQSLEAVRAMQSSATTLSP